MREPQRALRGTLRISFSRIDTSASRSAPSSERARPQFPTFRFRPLQAAARPASNSHSSTSVFSTVMLQIAFKLTHEQPHI